MTELLLNHLWQSTLFLILAATLAGALRRRPARARYWVWMAASLKFLLPFALLATLTVAPRNPAAPAATAPGIRLSQPFVPAPAVDSTSLVPQAPGRRAPSEKPWLLAIWALGSLIILGTWARRRWRLQAVIRGGKPARHLAPAFPGRVLITSGAVEPGLVGIFRPALLLPKTITAHLSSAQLRYVVAHELSHLRRRDNLAAALHMLVEAIFWFYPPVWWIGARLLSERELACDEAVLAAGANREQYAGGILRVCALYARAGLPCAAGVTGAGLKQRVAAIMNSASRSRLSRAWRLGLATLAALGVMLPFTAARWFAPRQATDIFSVVSVKEHDPADQVRSQSGPMQSGHWHARGLSLRNLILMAYPDEGRGGVVGLPDWDESKSWDIEAAAGPATVTPEVLRSMQRQMLAERFHLVLHVIQAPARSYGLEAPNGSSKLTPATGDCAPAGPSQPPGGGQFCGTFLNRRDKKTWQLIGESVSMADLSHQLDHWQRPETLPLVDATGIQGRFDITMEYEEAPYPLPGDPSGGMNYIAQNAALLQKALSQSLGLKLDLEPKMRPVESLVVDHASLPTAN